MKVMCIEDFWETPGNSIPADDNPKYGEILTVIGEYKDSEFDCYRFSEYGWENVYQKQAFIPLSSIDETELIKERQSELANA